ncbi:DExH-box ATP-dependent RNA helicase DExH7, chloroplastic isoform X2 [Mercurialis annua]|uniref:DExH-box ATP-dependent RNA helicase DExH7, chloroplastic isoform X2 n=1 Tax=Mercurialis annua TaxID=3986 RepID=UPI002160921F|nr:DExH-box ATP-dependent RNA helicase DExH7, chloroplastic isoform X2 [Mercurialis annua]
MAPKKKQNSNKKPNTKPQSSSSSGPRLQISAENENRLRRLLINSNRSITQPPPPVQENNLSKAQKAKRLKNVYEKLSCEGFSNDQIELALTSLKDNATFESALDWLCLNLPGIELPLKFSSGTSLYSTNEGSVSVISTAREDWTASDNATRTEDVEPVSVRIKGRWDDEDTLNSRQPSQADWIRQYMEQQDEDVSQTWEDYAPDGSFVNKDPVPRSYDIIVKEYCAARLEATQAKEKKDRKSQEQAGQVIRKLKHELPSLGLSEDILEQEFVHDFALPSVPEGMLASSTRDEKLQAKASSCAEDNVVFVLPSKELPADSSEIDCSSSLAIPVECIPSTVPVQNKTILEDEAGDVELGDFFLEDAVSNEALSSGVLELQKKEKLREFSSEKNLEKLDGIWKKGDQLKIPKAVLHQLCQKSGWEAPKFNRLHEKRKGFFYSLSILRKASGRGKSKKAGGLVTLQLPDQDETYETVEDAQNRVASFALHQLFPDLPVHLIVTSPYASLILGWKEEELSSKVENSIEDRRAGFVDRLLNADELDTSVGSINRPSETIQISHIEERDSLSNAGADLATQRENRVVDVESSYLRQEQEKKKKMQKYKDMLKNRAALPIAGLQNEILQMLKENNFLVICGETGSGKTTQVPQYILDDMIESGCGGQCNIICTQPRRIAAISVAERVADERCEPSPGSSGSLVGYQVRLDSARNEKTKLLFCTTGILLRKLAGDKNLTGITHVIVDEVHERSLLGDFLLIVLKNLIEKQADHGTPKLKVILMSATVNSTLFSSYFGHCPVLTAQGRTHPVTTYFLEDIYESIDYHLASDSPAAFSNQTSTINKSGSVNNRRGKKNLVLSGWGDDSLLSEDTVNPDYDSSSYQSYCEQTHKNLKRLNEYIIDYDLLEDLICHIDETYGEGSILVFLPGVSEIHMLLDRLVASYRFGGPSSDWILPLHSSIASADQKKAFLRPPGNIRKVIIATNIAETSITIDDVVYVIDCGKHKENRYNPQKKLTSMVEDWISQANARQRRGRAGRVKPGICFCLYTRHRFEKLMRPYQVPEMLRMPLVELCLQIKILSLGHIKPFLSKALEPPKDEAMTSAISLLFEVGAVEGDEELTPLGHHLAKLPVDLLIGKKGVKAAQQFCSSHFLSHSVLYMIRDMRIQFGTLLADIGFINLPKNYQILGRNKENLDVWLSDKSQPFNMYSHHYSIVKAILCAGLYPNVAASQHGITATAINNLKQSAISAKGHPVWYDGRREVHIHPSSINSSVKAFQHPFLVFLEKVETNKVYLRDTTIVSPYSILMFGGFINIQHQTGLVTMDGWLKLTAPAQYAVLFKEFRSALHSILKELVQKPKNTTIVDNEVIKSMIQLLLDEDRPSK